MIGLLKDELDGKIMTEFVRLILERSKTYSYLTDDGSCDNKAKGTKKCTIKWRLKIEDYKIYLQINKNDTSIRTKTQKRST